MKNILRIDQHCRFVCRQKYRYFSKTFIYQWRRLFVCLTWNGVLSMTGGRGTYSQSALWIGMLVSWSFPTLAWSKFFDYYAEVFMVPSRWILMILMTHPEVGNQWFPVKSLLEMYRNHFGYYWSFVVALPPGQNCLWFIPKYIPVSLSPFSLCWVNAVL